MAMNTNNSDRDNKHPIHTIILDSSPLLLNTPGISTLLANGNTLVTTPSVLSEIKNEEARSRVDTLYLPFLTLRSPKLESINFVKAFARKTGDAAVLSTTDLDVLALAYEVELERNGGDWRLRNSPGQKRVNGGPSSRESHQEITVITTEALKEKQQEECTVQQDDIPFITQQLETVKITHGQTNVLPSKDELAERTSKPMASGTGVSELWDITSNSEDDKSSESDGEWITPSNINRHQARDTAADQASKKENKILQVATMTGDFAMQNVLLQINLNLLSTKTCKRITQIKQFVLRCHACFLTVKDMNKQFCPRCGKPTLTRVSSTTNDKGEVKLHLKANMQWNNKGNVYSIPKPTTGTASHKWKGSKQGGGQGGWGVDLILAEDQKEYVRAMSNMKRTKHKDVMDEDVLPSILSGDRDRTGGQVRIGAGRNINSRKR